MIIQMTVVCEIETYHIKASLGTEALPREDCVMALGFFDGVHLGHRELIETAREIAVQKDLKLAVMTFFPHPSNVLPVKYKINQYLSPLTEKINIFSGLGVELLFIVEFDLDFAKLSPRDFVKKYVCGVNCKHVVAGFDFSYGHKGKGNMACIEEDGDGQFEITVVSKKEYDNNKISSTRIRELLQNGTIHEIPHYLGNYYSTIAHVETETIDDKHLLTSIKVTIKDYLLPRPGVYLVRLEDGENSYDGVCFLSGNTAGIQIDVYHVYGINFHPYVTIQWISELETLSPVKAAEMMRKVRMIG